MRRQLTMIERAPTRITRWTWTVDFGGWGVSGSTLTRRGARRAAARASRPERVT